MLAKVTGVAENYKILQSKYDGSWRRMWLSRPRVRTDGMTCIYRYSCRTRLFSFGYYGCLNPLLGTYIDGPFPSVVVSP